MHAAAPGSYLPGTAYKGIGPDDPRTIPERWGYDGPMADANHDGPDTGPDRASGGGTRWIERELTEAGLMLDALASCPKSVERIRDVGRRLAEMYRAGGKLLACGNGGSSCDAMHLCEELTGRFRRNRRPLGAIACVDPGHLTCTANDFGYQDVFARWVEALGRPGDALVCFSTSGNSENVVRAVAAARELGMFTVGLLGRDGGRLAGVCDAEWIVSGPVDPATGSQRPVFADRIQEIHMLIGHTLIGAVERELFGQQAVDPEPGKAEVVLASGARQGIKIGAAERDG